MGPAEAAGGRGGRRLAQQHHVRLRGSAHERRSGESPWGSGIVKYLLCLSLLPPPPITIDATSTMIFSTNWWLRINWH